MGKKRTTYLLLLMLQVLAACTHKDLYMGGNTAPTLVLQVDWHLYWNLEYLVDWDTEWNPDWEMDWSKVTPTEPEGVRLVTEAHEDGYRQVFNLPTGGGTVTLQPGTYTALLHNNDTEYIVFEGTDQVASTTATTRTRTRSPYSEENPAEVTVNPPDHLFASFAEEFHIEEIDEWVDGEEERVMVVDVPMYPVVFSYIVRFEFDGGKEYINEARGALSGMAGTVSLSDRRTLDDVVTILYEDAEVSDYGVEAVVRSFGLCNFDPVPTDDYPDGHYYTPGADDADNTTSRAGRPRAGDDTRNILTLELALKSGQRKTFEIDVTDRMREQPRGGVLLIQGLEVTPEEGEGSQTGGFEVSVDDWATRRTSTCRCRGSEQC